MDLTKFHYFFECCIGDWSIERTYHYLTHQEIERSHTEFQVAPIPPALKQKVLQDNQYAITAGVENLPGFQLAFQTVSEAGEEVSQELRALFVPKHQEGTALKGDYLRDRAYEESRPIVSHFSYDSETRELMMTTQYTKVVSVDSITLINPKLRIRRIFNYRRPIEGAP